MFSYEELDLGGLIGRFIRGGVLPSRVNETGVALYSGRSPEELVDLARSHQKPRGLTACFGGKIALTDGVIHHQDIRRPLGLPRNVPADRLLAILDFACTAPPLGASKRIRGLTLVATDVNWRTGRGPAVEGPAESLLMTIAGRPGVTDELTGPGKSTITNRIEA